MRLSALLCAGLVVLAGSGCGNGSDDPDPAPRPTSTTGSPVSSPEPTPCPPIAGFTERTVTVPLRAATPLPDGGQVRLVEVTPASGGGDASVKLEVTRPGCGSTELVLPQGGGAAASSVRVDVVSVNPSRNGMPPTAQLRIGPA